MEKLPDKINLKAPFRVLTLTLLAAAQFFMIGCGDVPNTKENRDRVLDEQEGRKDLGIPTTAPTETPKPYSEEV